MIIIEASSGLGLFEALPERVETTSLAIHEKMCPKVLDDVDLILDHCSHIHTYF